MWHVVVRGLLFFVISYSTIAWADTLPSYRGNRAYTESATGEQTDNPLWTPEAGNRVVLLGCAFSSDTATTIELEVSNVDVLPPVYLTVHSNAAIEGSGFPIYRGTADQALDWTSSGPGTATITCWGFED